MGPAEEFQVGEWRVRPPLNEIQNSSEVRHLEPKVMNVLCYLAGHAGAVLTKEQIIQAVWPNTFVTDWVLSHAISEARKALGDDAGVRFLGGDCLCPSWPR